MFWKARGYRKQHETHWNVMSLSLEHFPSFIPFHCPWAGFFAFISLSCHTSKAAFFTVRLKFVVYISVFLVEPTVFENKSFQCSLLFQTKQHIKAKHSNNIYSGRFFSPNSLSVPRPSDLLGLGIYVLASLPVLPDEDIILSIASLVPTQFHPIIWATAMA